MNIKDNEIEIRLLHQHEVAKFRQLIDLFHEVFETKKTEVVDDHYLKQLLENPGFLVFAIFRNDTILGGATAFALPMYYTRSTELFIYDVAIDTKHQRAGLGAKLIAAMKEHCRKNDIGEMFVPAHEEDTHALNFYRATGGDEEKVVHFNYTVKR